MSPDESSELIAAAGGVNAFGQLLGIDSGDGWQQRVNNWRHRGIPAAVVLEHYEVIQKLRSKARRRRVS